MQDTIMREATEHLLHETENTAEEVRKDVPTVDGPKPSLPETADIPSKDQAEIKSSDEVEKLENDLAKKAVNDKNAGDEVEAPSANGASSPAATPSQRVQEGKSWNDRNRQKVDYTKNIKSDFTSQEQSDDPVAIRKQVEFYFSDSNLLVDRFLFTKVEGHKNLPVPISIIHSFNRMRHFQPFSAVVEAIRGSTILNLVENDTCIQRKIPLAEGLRDKPMHEIEKVYEDEAMARSIYAKGFGEEKPSTQFDIEAFFADYGPTNSVRLRRAHDKMFKGSVFVEFDSESTQRDFLALDPKPKWKGLDLEIKSKKKYCDEKVEDIRAGRIQPKSSAWAARGNKQRKEGDRRRDGDDRDWRTRREDDRTDGFGDRKHRGFGSSGQNGRGGGRGGRGGRWGARGGRDGRDNNRRKDRDEHQVPKIAVPASTTDALPSTGATHKPSTPEEPMRTDTTEKNTTASLEKKSIPPSPTETTIASTEPVSKKRAREDNDEEINGGNAKKPDLKGSEELEP